MLLYVGWRKVYFALGFLKALRVLFPTSFYLSLVDNGVAGEAKIC